MIIHIDSVEDTRLAPYTSVKERDLVRNDKRFIVEGKITVERLITDSHYEVESLFLSETRLKPLKKMLWKLDPSVPVYAAPQKIMDNIAGFHLHRGVLAVAKRDTTTTSTAALLEDLSQKDAATILVLLGLSNHDNVGACFRNAAALGADAILLDETCCDPLYRKSIRVSAGTALSLPFAKSGSAQQLVEQLTAYKFTSLALSPTNGTPIHQTTPPSHLALLLGAEGPGLDEEIMAQTQRISIPMSAGIDSLNVATAGAVALSHLGIDRP